MSRSIQKTKLPLPRRRISSEVFSSVLSPGCWSLVRCRHLVRLAGSSAFTSGGRYSSRNCNAALRPERRSTLTACRKRCRPSSIQRRGEAKRAATCTGIRSKLKRGGLGLPQWREQHSAILIWIGVGIGEFNHDNPLPRRVQPLLQQRIIGFCRGGIVPSERELCRECERS